MNFTAARPSSAHYQRATARAGAGAPLLAMLQPRVTTYTVVVGGGPHLAMQESSFRVAMCIHQELVTRASQPTSAPTPRSPREQVRALRDQLSHGDPSAAAKLAGYLAWRGEGWTSDDRLAVVAALRAHALRALPSVLDAVAACARANVVDAAVNALRGAAESVSGTNALATALQGHDSPDARMAVARALGAARGLARDDACHALVGALRDPDADVRESAAWALVNLGVPAAKDALGAARDRERNEAVRASLDEAIDALSDG